MARINYRTQIMAALKEHGPMTAIEISDSAGIARRKVAGCIASARFQSPGVFFRVVRCLPITGRRQRDACVFAAEAGEDVPRKPFTRARQAARQAQAKARYGEKHRAAMNARSVLRKAALTGRVVAVNPWLQLAAPKERSTVSRLSNEMRAMCA